MTAQERATQIITETGSTYRRHREFLWLLSLAVIFRLLAVTLLTQGGYFLNGPAGHDYGYYWQIGELALEGRYPSVHYWMEYPPIFTWTIVGLYRLSLLLPAMVDQSFSFQMFLGSFLALVEGANLALIYFIECSIAGRAVAIRASWIYALLFAPIFVMMGWFDPLPLFFLLLAVYGLATNRPVLAGIACGAGFMTKVVPAIVAPIGLRAFPAGFPGRGSESLRRQGPRTAISTVSGCWGTSIQNRISASPGRTQL
jgi:uncharacterized membrane protein